MKEIQKRLVYDCFCLVAKVFCDNRNSETHTS